MSTTRSQKRKNNQQESAGSVSEGLVSPIVVENPLFSDQDVSIAGPSRPKSPRIENIFLENLRASSKEEITSENKSLLIESQKEMFEQMNVEIYEYEYILNFVKHFISISTFVKHKTQKLNMENTFQNNHNFMKMSSKSRKKKISSMRLALTSQKSGSNETCNKYLVVYLFFFYSLSNVSRLWR